MQILKNVPNFDYMSKRRIAVAVSTALNVLIIVGIAIFGFNLGVDFAGGTVVEVKFNQPTTVEQVRQRAEGGGLEGVTVTPIGSAGENTYLLRMGGVTQLTPEKRDAVQTAIGGLGDVKRFDADLDNGLINVRFANPTTQDALRQAVTNAGVGVNEIRELGAAEGGGFDYQVVASGVADQVFAALSAGHLDANGQPDFIKQRVDYVGPQVGKQLRNRGIMAVVYAMIAILIYVAFRFDFKFGPGALLSMVHDVIMVAGFYLVSRAEFNLTAIAALLTVLGYSVNDTIVIYDRVREEMSKFKGKPLAEIINHAINHTLSRTILTGLSVVLAVFGLIVFGVGEIRDFAIAMLVGVVVGTYSSIFIASPLTIWLDERQAAKARRQATASKTAAA